MNKSGFICFILLFEKRNRRRNKNILIICIIITIFLHLFIVLNNIKLQSIKKKNIYAEDITS